MRYGGLKLPRNADITAPLFGVPECDRRMPL
jgi:hypothetical protein